MEKLERDGQVAIVYSPGFGAGWVTWAHTKSEQERAGLVMDADIARAVLAKDFEKAVEIARARYDPKLYDGGAEDLEVKWLSKGTRFFIDEYDGSESVVILAEIPAMTA